MTRAGCLSAVALLAVCELVVAALVALHRISSDLAVGLAVVVAVVCVGVAVMWPAPRRRE